MVVWLIGMSGAGKTVIGRELYQQMKADNPATVLVDGDEIRAIFRQDRSQKDYSIESRKRNAERIRELCAWLERQDIDVVCCILSIFEQSHIWNRKNYKEYFEVYISAPMDVLEKRNTKNLYKKAKAGEIENVVGVDIPYSPPHSPDMVIENGEGLVDPVETARQIRAGMTKRREQLEDVYSYTQGDLLESPNTYAYTPYNGNAFLSSWRRNREQILAYLPDPAPCPEVLPTTNILSAGETISTAQDLEKALWELLKAHGEPDMTNFYKLLNRFEVTKKIFPVYTKKWRPTTPDDCRQYHLYIRFSEVLAMAYEKTERLFYLNALIKCLDVLVSVCEKLDAALQGRLASLLNNESLYVKNLIEKVGARR